MSEYAKSFVETDNYNRLFEGVQRLKRLPKDAPRMGIAYGKYGLGKTNALDRIASKENAILMRCRKTWSKKAFLVDLGDIIGDITGRTAHDMYIEVVKSLNRHPRILIIDEVDHLLDDRKIPVLELIRDIYDETSIIVLFVGMEQAKGKFAKHEHYNSRISDFIHFQPVTEVDIRKFCDRYTVKIADDLVIYFLQYFPNLRHIKTLMERIEEWCEINDHDTVDLKQFHTAGLKHGLGE